MCVPSGLKTTLLAELSKTSWEGGKGVLRKLAFFGGCVDPFKKRSSLLFPDTVSKVIHCRGRRAAAKPPSLAAPAVNNFAESASGACEELALGQQSPGAQSAEAGTVFFS